MTEYGQPFDDSLGDAAGLSPYGSTQLSKFLQVLGDFVIPVEYTTDLYTSSPLLLFTTGASPVGVVEITQGKAIVDGRLYVLDANTFVSIDAAVNNRIDRVVLRVSTVNQTVRLAVIKGTEAANPTIPNIAATDMSLGWVWIPAGFNPAADQIGDEEVHDERIFFPTGQNAYYQNSANLIKNSEYIAYSLPASGTDAPENFRPFIAAGTITGTTLLTNNLRGRSIRVNATNVNPTGVTVWVNVSENNIYTLYGTINITSGSAHITFGSISKVFRQTGTNVQFVIRENIIDAATNYIVQLVLRNNSVISDFYIGQLQITQGVLYSQPQQQHDIVMLYTALTDANWTATAKSTGTTLIDLTADFGGIFTADMPIRGVILRLRANDSGSSGAGNYGLYTAVDSSTPLSRLLLNRVPNDKPRDTVAFAPMIGGMGTTFYLGVDASGVATLDATVEIIGIVT